MKRTPPLAAGPLPGPADARALLRNPAFLRYWCARVLSMASFQIVSVVVGWQVYELTHSVFYLGLVGLMQFLAIFVLTLPAGMVADRHDRRLILRVCQGLSAIVAAALALGSLGGWLGIPAIFAGITLIGISRAFEHPTTQAFLANVVVPHDMPRALALASSAMQTAIIVGPALGGLLYIAGPGVAYGAVAVFYLLASLLIAGIKVRHVPPPREPVRLKNVFSGFTFIKSKPLILGAISLDLMAVLLGGATALLPVFAQDILHVGPVGLGALRAAPAVGALLVSVILARHPLRRRAGPAMFAAVATFGLATVVFGLSTWFPLSFLALVVLGGVDVVSVVVRGSLVQLGTPDAMRGRVSAVNSLFIGTSNQLGEFESGMTAALLGTVPAVVLGGVGTVVVAVLWMRMFPALRRVDDLAAVR